MKHLFDPILSCDESAKLEHEILGDSSFSSFNAMSRAGEGAAKDFLKEFSLPADAKILGLIGNGHNGGDSLIALKSICTAYPKAYLTLVLDDNPRPNTAQALENLHRNFTGPTIEVLHISKLSTITNRKFDLVLEGIVGMSFRPPAREYLVEAINAANSIDAYIKVSIDTPAGSCAQKPENPMFRADVTYATGIAKDVLFKDFNRDSVGRIRYIDVGFFDEERKFDNQVHFIARPDALESFKKLRNAFTDKRNYGNLFIIAGSRSYPGTALLNARAALRSGAGLVTVFVPESLAPSFAAAEPSAIWVACPEDEHGAIALEAFGTIRARLDRADALLAGSGLSESDESHALIAEVLKAAPDLPVVLDADAIYEPIAKVLPHRNAPALLTPHEGEILRVAKDASDEALIEACRSHKCCIALKSSATRIADENIIVRSVRGGPVLARAGSGDLLAGLAGGLMAQKKFESARDIGICASQWLGLAAEGAFSELGETAVATSDILRFLPKALA